jgi:arylformamidase
VNAVKLIDLSHTVREGLVTYPGLPAPLICDFLSREASREKYAPGVEFQIGKIELVANTGTYVDAPSHRYAGGMDLSELPLDCLADLPGLLVSTTERAIGPEHFESLELRGRAVLVHTGWSQHFGTPEYFEGAPFLTAAAAELLRVRAAALVGIDSLNIDDIQDPARPVHSTLLGAGIPICEHLTGLDPLPREGFRFSAVPVKVKGMGTFPVRAYANIP